MGNSAEIKRLESLLASSSLPASEMAWITRYLSELKAAEEEEKERARARRKAVMRKRDRNTLKAQLLQMNGGSNNE